MISLSSLLRIILTLLMVSAIACSDNTEPADNTPPATSNEWDIPGWTLVWQDEFNGNSIDSNKWDHEVNAAGGGNNELQYYTARSENSRVADGRLIITARKETFTGPEGTREYTSARLRTPNKGDWVYGRFDVRAKLPEGQGLWPAIWMLPTDWEYGGWAASGEIDIMELLGHEPWKVYATLHFGGEWPNNRKSPSGVFELNQGTFSQDFHVFTLVWEPAAFHWYVDGEHYHTETQWSSDGQPYPAPFDKRFHLLLNVAVGGNWPGDPDLSTIFPQTMEVDYVRVYTKNEE